MAGMGSGGARVYCLDIRVYKMWSRWDPHDAYMLGITGLGCNWAWGFAWDIGLGPFCEHSLISWKFEKFVASEMKLYTFQFRTNNNPDAKNEKG